MPEGTGDDRESIRRSRVCSATVATHDNRKALGRKLLPSCTGRTTLLYTSVIRFYPLVRGLYCMLSHRRRTLDICPYGVPPDDRHSNWDVHV